MSDLSIAICDDLAEERAKLAKMVLHYCKQKGITPHLKLFSNGDELLDGFRRPGQFQIVFLDIYMPGRSGMETARRIRTVDRNVALLFATTSQDHGMDSFEVRAADYLVKPFQEEEVARALDWCLTHLPEPMRCLSIYAEGEERELPLCSIWYIDVYGHQCHIHTQPETLVTRRGLDDLEVAIDSSDFLRCHRSYLVNMNYIQGLEGNHFRMSDGNLIPIGSTYSTQTRNHFIDWTYLKAWNQI